MEGSFGHLEGSYRQLGGTRLEGYEIHMGETILKGNAKPATSIEDSVTGEQKQDGAYWENVCGTYVHGVFDKEAVAEGIDQAHGEISVLQYNNENSLSCTIALAFYFAREYYHVIRELPTGKGFADICLIPRKKYAQKPAAIIELKWDKSAEGAIAQIKEKNYPEALEDYHGNLLLAGINYDKKNRKHTCKIEKLSV